MLAVLGTLGGVALGFFLQSLSQKKKDEALLTKKRAAIEGELGTNGALIPQKKELLLKIQRKLRKGEIFRAPSIRFPAYCYRDYIGEVSVLLTSVQRENLVVIYETLRILDEYMDHFHSEYLEVSQSKIFSDIDETYIGEIGDLVDQFSLVETLISKYLADEPMKIPWDKLPRLSREIKDIPKEK